MIGRLLNSEAANIAAVIALVGAIPAPVASGPGRRSPGRMVYGAFSNPVPRSGPSGTGPVPHPLPERRAAA